MEPFNETLIERLRFDVGDRHDNWDGFIQPPTYDYNAQADISTHVTPFCLIRTGEPPGPADIVSQTFGENTKTDGSPQKMNAAIQ